MNKIGREEFKDRTEAILRARSIFIDSGVTANISIAFELYQGILAEQERKLVVSNRDYDVAPESPCC